MRDSRGTRTISSPEEAIRNVYEREAQAKDLLIAALKIGDVDREAAPKKGGAGESQVQLTRGDVGGSSRAERRGRCSRRAEAAIFKATYVKTRRVYSQSARHYTPFTSQGAPPKSATPTPATGDAAQPAASPRGCYPRNPRFREIRNPCPGESVISRRGKKLPKRRWGPKAA
jgi:hypothetical protein